MLERESVKKFKANMDELETRKKKMEDAELDKAKDARKEFANRQKAAKFRQEQERREDEKIVHSLYNIEVKSKLGQDRAKNWTEHQIKGKAQTMNKRVDDLKSIAGTTGTSSREQLEIDRLAKVVAK